MRACSPAPGRAAGRRVRAGRALGSAALLAVAAAAAAVAGRGAPECSQALVALAAARLPGLGCWAAARPARGRWRRPPAAAAGGGSGLWLPDARLVEAVEGLGGRVTKADLLAGGVAAEGLERELLQLARASGAGLQVNDAGEVLFEFPADLSGSLRKHSLALRLRRAYQVAKPWVGWGGRVVFGASLLAVVALVYCAVLIVLSTSTSKSQDEDGNRMTIVSQNNFALWFGPDLFFWLAPRPYSYYSYYDGGVLYSEFYEPPPKMSFLESVFSFVFGDGDPNAQVRSETRWQLIGECIAQNGGAVVAEQIAPYLDPLPGGPKDAVDEQRALNQAMLPVLLRFRGRPEVGAEGDIVYVFPELQEGRAAGEAIVGSVPTKELKRRLEAVGCPSSAVERAGVIDDYRRAVGEMRRQGTSPAEYLPERELKLSEADEGQIAACAAFGAFALLGMLYLGTQISSGKLALLARFYPIIALVLKLYPWLLLYTVAFLGIPLWRWLRLARMNKVIRQRNEWRARQAAKLEQASAGLRRRITDAANWARKLRSFGNAIYNSAESASVRQSKSEADDLKSFDERLERNA